MPNCSCQYTLDDTDTPQFSHLCREAKALYKETVHAKTLPERNQAAQQYLEHTKEAWPASWFEALPAPPEVEEVPREET